MLRKLYDWVFVQARKPHAEKALAVVSFAEASFFPIPPDVMLAPMILSRPDRAYRYAAVCSLASLLGGLLGYAIGVFLEPLALKLLAIFGHGMDMAVYQSWFATNGFLVILGKGLTPIPFKLVTIASGLAAGVDAAFWGGTAVKTLLVCNLGHGDPAGLRPRAARLDFDDACRIL